MAAKDTYLGDGVYARLEGGMVEVYTHDGEQKTNVIYFETIVLEAFMMYLKRERLLR